MKPEVNVNPVDDKTTVDSAPVADVKKDMAPEKLTESAITVDMTDVKDENSRLEKRDDGVYRLATPDAGVQFKQVGFIDLSNINSKTRPDKKSKAERRKEREEKEKLRQDAKAKYKDAVMKEIGGKKDGAQGSELENGAKKRSVTV